MAEVEDFGEACEQLGFELSTDVYYLVPSDESRFEPLSIATVVAGVIVGGFCEGMLGVAREKASEAGEAAGRWLAARLEALINRDPGEAPTPPDEDPELQDLVARMREAAAQLDRGEVEDLARQVQADLTAALQGQSMPEDVAMRTTQRVRETTVELTAT